MQTQTTGEISTEAGLARSLETGSVADLITRASERFGALDYEGAKAVLGRAIELYPDRCDLRVFQGNVLYHLQDLAGARRQFERAVVLDSSNAVAHTSLAAAQMTLGEFADSERSIKEAIRLSPGDVESVKFLGALCLQRGRFAEGVETYRVVLERMPTDEDALMSQGRCFFEEGDLASAGRNFAQVLALDPGNKLAKENLAVVRKRAGVTGQVVASEAETVQQQFDSLGPWFTRFDIGGVGCGGEYSYANDLRMSDFLEWHGMGGRLLDVGSFEGAHSFTLASRSNVGSVVGVDSKPRVVARANLVKDLIGAEKVCFKVCDVEGDELEQLGRFDAVFCAGLLYYMAEPWRLVQRLSGMTDRLFISTHYAETGGQKQLHYDGVRRGMETPSDLRGGMVEEVFWPTFKSLIQMLTEHGFRVARVRDYPEWPDAPLVNLYCEK